MIAKLVAWDKQLEAAQSFMENQSNACTDNVQSDFTQQIESEVEYQRHLRHAQANMRKMQEEGDDEMDDGSAGGMGRAKGMFGF